MYMAHTKATSRCQGFVAKHPDSSACVHMSTDHTHPSTQNNVYCFALAARANLQLHTHLGLRATAL